MSPRPPSADPSKGLQDVTQVVPGIDIYKWAPRPTYWYARCYKDERQDYVKKSLRIKDKAEALKWVLDNLREVMEWKTREEERGETLRALLVAFNEWQRERYEVTKQIRKSSFYSYEGRNRYFIEYFQRKNLKYLSQIKRLTMKGYATERVKEDGVETGTANQDVTYIRAFFHWLQGEGKLAFEPVVEKLGKPADERLANPPFHPEDLERILQRMKDYAAEAPNEFEKYQRGMLELYIHVLLDSGARQHELLKLKWRDVERGRTNSKGQRPVTVARIPENTKRGFRKSLWTGDSMERTRAFVTHWSGKPSNDDFIFRTLDEPKAQDQSTFRRRWINQILKPLELDYNLHSTRSQTITEMVLAEVPLPLIARNCGLSVKQIETSYLRYCPEAQASLILREKKEEDSYIQTMEWNLRR